MLKMSKETIEEIFGDLSEVCERFRLKSISVNEFIYDSDRDEIKLNFSMTVKSSDMAEISGIEEADLKELMESMEESELVSPEEVFGDEILGKEE